MPKTTKKAPGKPIPALDEKKVTGKKTASDRFIDNLNKALKPRKIDAGEEKQLRNLFASEPHHKIHVNEITQILSLDYSDNFEMILEAGSEFKNLKG